MIHLGPKENTPTLSWPVVFDLPLGDWGLEEVALARLQPEVIGMVERAWGTSPEACTGLSLLSNGCVTLARTNNLMGLNSLSLGQEAWSECSSPPFHCGVWATEGAEVTGFDFCDWLLYWSRTDWSSLVLMNEGIAASFPKPHCCSSQWVLHAFALMLGHHSVLTNLSTDASSDFSASNTFKENCYIRPDLGILNDRYLETFFSGIINCFPKFVQSCLKTDLLCFEFEKWSSNCRLTMQLCKT